MSLNTNVITQNIKSFDFKNVFNELGWDNYNQKIPIAVDDIEYSIQGIAEKKDFGIFTCCIDGKLPEYPIRKKIENKITSYAFEHILIFFDSHKTKQVWQWVKREKNKPIAPREVKYHSGQEPDSLIQKLAQLEFTIDEEESISISDVKGRSKKAFDVEKITKEFYTKFKKEHTAFQDFIEGIDDKVNIDWYTSLMLNRLMFIYFIQKKGFLDNNTEYLKNKLDETQSKQGHDQFHSFYKNFLLVLFHQGLGRQIGAQN
jgi:hypothetical protein